MRCVLHQLHKLYAAKTGRCRTAWLLALVCAWMGTGGVLHHSDADSAAKSHTASHLGRQMAATPPSETCAACDWTQGLTAKTSAVSNLPSPLFLLHSYTPSLPTRPVACALRLRSSRAPPAIL